MRRWLVIGLALLFLWCPLPATAGQKTITFQWDQTMAPDLYGWKMWHGEVSGGPYTQLGTDIVYDGTPQPSYEWTAPAIIVPDGEEKTFYFVVNAWDTNGNFSDDSNEVMAVIDFKPPTVPTVDPVPPAVGDPALPLTGSKEANSSIWINGAEAVPLDAATTWAHTVTLVEGDNTITVTSKDGEGNESAAAQVSVHLDTTKPPTPVQLRITVSTP